MFDQAAKLQPSVRRSTGDLPDSLKVAWNKRKEMGQAHQGVVDEKCCEWMTFKMRKVQHIPNLRHTPVRVIICDQVRQTEKMCTTFAYLCTRNL